MINAGFNHWLYADFTLHKRLYSRTQIDARFLRQCSRRSASPAAAARSSTARITTTLAIPQITRAAFWMTTLKRLGIRHRRTYNMGHPYATIGLMSGVNSAFMARQLGHSLEIFFKVYAKWIDA